MQQSPKHIIKNFQNRNHAFGRERRLNMDKIVLENNPHFPRTLSYSDIDREIFNWVDNEFNLTYDGKKFETYKLFSNQRISEYGQTWQNLDEKGNLNINFKTITRESNPQKGEMQGGFFNIPGEVTFPIFKVLALDENGVEYLEVYSMKQPVPVNLIYTIGIFTNTYSKLNDMNMAMQKQFKSIEKYIFPNGFSIPMELSSISDESDYTIDDRKYYSQTFQIKVMGYIITEDDYIVKKVPYKPRLQFVSGVNSSLKKERKKFDIQPMINTERQETVVIDKCENIVELENIKEESSIDNIMNTPKRKADIEISELCGTQKCWEDTEDEFYVNRKVIINITLDYCDNIVEFISDYHLGIEGIELKNVKNYKVFIDGLLIDFNDSDVEILKNDTIRVEVEVSNEKEPARMTFICYDIDSIIRNDEDNSAEVISVYKD